MVDVEELVKGDRPGQDGRVDVKGRILDLVGVGGEISGVAGAPDQRREEQIVVPLVGSVLEPADEARGLVPVSPFCSILWKEQKRLL